MTQAMTMDNAAGWRIDLSDLPEEHDDSMVTMAHLGLPSNIVATFSTEDCPEFFEDLLDCVPPGESAELFVIVPHSMRMKHTPRSWWTKTEIQDATIYMI